MKRQMNISRRIVDIFLLIITVTIGFILSMAMYVAIQYLQEKIFISGDYIFYVFKSPGSYLVFLFEVEIIILLLILINKFRKSNKYAFAVNAHRLMKKYWLVSLLFNIFLLYVSLTSISVVTSEEIVDYSFYNPGGTTYTYDEIESVETGFYGNKAKIGNYRGSFYYNVTFKNNKTINMENATSRSEDTYTEYIEFDKLVMSQDVKKISSTENAKYASLDEIYINRLYEVINNKK